MNDDFVKVYLLFGNTYTNLKYYCNLTGISFILFTLCTATSKNDDQMNSTDSPKKPVTQDVDYWDNDDFVPFQSNRHDEFDWKLTKVFNLQQNKLIIFR